MNLKLIYLQYPLETLAFIGLGYACRLAWRKPIDRGKALRLLVGSNMLRFAGAGAAFAALEHSRAPAFLVQVAVGDFVTAVLAVIAFILLRRGSPRALTLVAIMNVVGLSDILLSEAWLGHLELTGAIVRSAAIHGPSVGAALYTALHLLMLYIISGQRARADESLPRDGSHMPPVS